VKRVKESERGASQRVKGPLVFVLTPNLRLKPVIEDESERRERAKRVEESAVNRLLFLF
jgi:hypothetical protein